MDETGKAEAATLYRRLRDPARLAALKRVGLLDTPPEEEFDQITRLARMSLGVPFSLVTLVDEDRQFFKSCEGLPEPWASRRQTPLSHSFCQHTLVSKEPLVIDDARKHPLVGDNRAITEMGVVAYAGIPLITPDGHVLGSLCAIDTRPREWTPAEVRTLRSLAAAVMTLIEQRAGTQPGEAHGT
jgi:GAF domain-containing protein